MKIAVALSGGVDSTAAALRLKQAGHEVVGLTMRLCPDLSGLLQARAGQTGHDCAICAAPCACVDGSRIAAELGIQHEILDLRAEFEKRVIAPFVRDYSQGLTPNPCAVCNREMKFGLLLERARELGADRLATGHYARLQISGGEARVLRSRDQNRDQTYFLSLVPAGQFRYILFPLGDELKTDVRKDAPFHPPADDYAASVEICFLRDCNYVDFLKQRAPEAFRPGEIVDEEGRVLGQHAGLPAYTIGQRRGLGVAAPHPLYVVRLEAEGNRVVVGPDGSLWSRTARLTEMNWFMDPPENALALQARVRYRQPLASATVRALSDREAHLIFDRPLRAITPGQVAAVYLDDRLVAGGKIFAAQKSEQAGN